MAECEEALPHLPIVSAYDVTQRYPNFLGIGDTYSWEMISCPQDLNDFICSCTFCHQPGAAYFESTNNLKPQVPWNFLNCSDTDRFGMPPSTKDEDGIHSYSPGFNSEVDYSFLTPQLTAGTYLRLGSYEWPSPKKSLLEAIARLETVDATVRELNSAHPRRAASVGAVALASFSRRGRGQRRNKAYWKTVVEHDEPQNPFERDCLFGSVNGPLTTPATSYMDSTSTIPRCMSMKYLHELGLESHLSAAFEDPGLLSIGMGGQKAKVTGIVRDVAFRLKGASTTFTGDFYVSELLDGFYDILFGWQFMSNEAADILEKAHKVYQDAKAFLGNAASKLTAKIGNVVSQTQRRVSDFVNGVSLPPPPYSLVNILEGDYVVAPRVL